MKKILIICAVVTMLCVIVTTSRGEQFWVKTYGGGSLDGVYSIQQTLDEGYILVGYTDYFIVDNIDCWVLKLDRNGNIMWQKIYYGGESADELGLSIQQTTDEGYIMAGSTFASSPPFDVWIIKLDNVGNIVWQKNFERTGSITILQSIQQTSDGGYIIAGYTEISEDAEVWILKLDSNGDLMWQKTYGCSDREAARSVQQTSDGGYIVAGSTHKAGIGISSSDALIIKLDSNGDIIWQKKYGGDDSDSIASIRETTDGGYIAVGSTNSFGAGGYDIWVLRLDSSGNISWQKTYGGTYDDESACIWLTADSRYVIGGYTTTHDWYADAWLLNLDGGGDIIWQKTYRGEGLKEAKSIQQTLDGGYIVAGDGGLNVSWNSDVWIMKLDTNGDISDCNIVGTSSATVSYTSVIGQDYNATMQLASFPASISNFISQATNIEPSIVCCYDVDDYDCDYILNTIDNCPNHYNPLQEDTYPPGGNGIGDACDCEGDFNCDGNVDANDVSAFLEHFGRSQHNRPCSIEDPCHGDFTCNGNVDAADVTKFLEDFGRSQYNNPCPACVAGIPWCNYQ